jgi:hypothetical protein
LRMIADLRVVASKKHLVCLFTLSILASSLLQTSSTPNLTAIYKTIPLRVGKKLRVSCQDTSHNKPAR